MQSLLDLDREAALFRVESNRAVFPRDARPPAVVLEAVREIVKLYERIVEPMVVQFDMFD